jgi:hypothetical protein
VNGPFCWTIPPFTDLLALTFIQDGPNTAAVAGRSVFANTAVTGAAFLEGDGVTVNMVATVGQERLAGSAFSSAFMLQVRFNNFTGAGSGQCQVVNTGVGTESCFTGTDISFVFGSCPIGALPAASQQSGLRAGGD